MPRKSEVYLKHICINVIMCLQKDGVATATTCLLETRLQRSTHK